MAVLWRLRRASVGDVVTAMNQTRAVSYSTVQTILRILEAKGYVAHEKVARAFIYRAAGRRASGAPPGAEASASAHVQRVAEPARAQRARGRRDRSRGIPAPQEIHRGGIGARHGRSAELALARCRRRVGLPLLLPPLDRASANVRYAGLLGRRAAVIALPALPRSPCDAGIPAAFRASRRVAIVTMPDAWWTSTLVPARGRSGPPSRSSGSSRRSLALLARDAPQPGVPIRVRRRGFRSGLACGDGPARTLALSPR